MVTLVSEKLTDIDPPSLIIYLTILYYISREFFTICGENMYITDGDTVSTNITYGSTAFGNILITQIPSAKYIWKFQIMDKQDWSTITFGISDLVCVLFSARIRASADAGFAPSSSLNILVA